MSKDKNVNGDNDLKGYKDLGGVTLERMNFGLWLSNNRRRIIMGIIIFLIALSAFFFIFSGYSYIAYFLTGSNDQNTDNSVATSPRQVTEELQISAPQIFKSDGHNDLAVKMKNPNDKFMATFNYCFNPAGLSASELASTTEKGSACGSGFILPGEEKYILALGRDMSGVSSVEFKLNSVSWSRFDGHQIPDWNNFYFSRLNFAVSDTNFVPAVESTLSSKVALNSLDFKIKNDTPYSYYSAPIDILLFSGTELVGVNSYILSNFLAGETRSVSLTWPGNISGVNKTEIKPDINILDDSVYLKYQGGNQ